MTSADVGAVWRGACSTRGVKRKLDEMTREAKEDAERAQDLRERLREATASIDGLVLEARSTLKRAAEFLEREGLRGTRSGMFLKVTADGKPAAATTNESAPTPPKKPANE